MRFIEALRFVSVRVGIFVCVSRSDLAAAVLGTCRVMLVGQQCRETAFFQKGVTRKERRGPELPPQARTARHEPRDTSENSDTN
jgi:hypothetical protein